MVRRLEVYFVTGAFPVRHCIECFSGKVIVRTVLKQRGIIGRKNYEAKEKTNSHALGTSS